MSDYDQRIPKKSYSLTKFQPGQKCCNVNTTYLHKNISNLAVSAPMSAGPKLIEGGSLQTSFSSHSHTMNSRVSCPALFCWSIITRGIE